MNDNFEQMTEDLFLSLERYWLILVWVLFAVTVALWSVNLSAIPVSDSEAQLAIAASKIASREEVGNSILPIYTGLTGMLNYVFGTSDFWSRALPILFGSSLVFIPGLWKRELGFRRVVFLSLAVSLTPVLTYYSRTITSPVFAVSTLVWLATLVRRQRWVSAGIAFAGFLLSGLMVVPLILLLLTGPLLSRTTRNLGQDSERCEFNLPKKGAIQFASGALVALLVISSSFLLNPAGISDLSSALLTFLEPLRDWQPLEIKRFVVLLFRYNLIPVIIWFIAVLKSGFFVETKRRVTKFWIIIGGFCILLAVFESGFWLPFNLIAWALGTVLFSNWKIFSAIRTKYSFVLVIFGIALLIYVSMVAKTLAATSLNQLSVALALAAGLILFGLAHLFVGLGWSGQASKSAALISISFLLIFSMLSANFHLVLANPKISATQYQRQPVYSGETLKRVLKEFQRMGSFKAGELMIRVDAQPVSPYLWLTREFTKLTADSAMLNAPVVISDVPNPGLILENDYRGMTLYDGRQIDWAKVKLGQLVAGIFDLELPTSTTQTYLWIDKINFTGN